MHHAPRTTKSQKKCPSAFLRKGGGQKWASARQNLQHGLSAQRSFRSAWASAQYNPSLCCHEKAWALSWVQKAANRPILTKQHRARRYEFTHSRASELAIARLEHSSVYGWKQSWPECLWSTFESRDDPLEPGNDTRAATWRGVSGMYMINGGTLTAYLYKDEVLNPIVRPFAGAIGDNFILMQNNVRPPHPTSPATPLRVGIDYLNHETTE